MNRIWPGIFALLLGISVSSCGKRHVQLDRETRRMIDTLSAKQIQTLRPVLDSICELKMDSLVTIKTDSILNERKEEIRKLLGK